MLCFFQIGCKPPVKAPKKLISNETAIMLDNYFENREITDIPNDDRKTFGYTFEEMEHYLAYLKQHAKQRNIVLDSLKFVIAAYPPNQELNNKIYRTIYLKPTYKNGSSNQVNKAQVSNNNNHSEEAMEDTAKTILDMSGCCPSSNYQKLVE